MTLTDAEVAALAVGTDHIARLAAEVQEHRQRRCDHCAHWYTDASYKPGFGHCTVMSQASAGWWFCADFTANPPL